MLQFFVMFESGFVSLVLYAAQQLGVVLAVGGQTCALVSYLLAMRDRRVDDTEVQFARAVHTVLSAGVALMVLSGIGITLAHYEAGELAVLAAPAYLFKWALIGIGIFLLRGGLQSRAQWVREALAGGTWYALFFLHILAPDAAWANLALLYAGWMAAFFLCWTALVFGTRERGTATPAPSAAKEVSSKIATQSKPASSLPNIPSIPAKPPMAPPLKPIEVKKSEPPKPELKPEPIKVAVTNTQAPMPPPAPIAQAQAAIVPPSRSQPVSVVQQPIVRPVHIPIQMSVAPLQQPAAVPVAATPLPATPVAAKPATPLSPPAAAQTGPQPVQPQSALAAIRVMPKAPPA